MAISGLSGEEEFPRSSCQAAEKAHTHFPFQVGTGIVSKTPFKRPLSLSPGMWKDTGNCFESLQQVVRVKLQYRNVVVFPRFSF